MKYGINRSEALVLHREYVQTENMFRHCLATEAVMKALAARLGEDEEKWALAGLLHDLDAEIRPDLSEHTLEAEQILSRRGVDPEIVDAIRMHNEAAHGARRSTRFQHALAAGETITGLITATAMVYPDKRLASVKAKSVTKRMKEPRFAAGANRDIIRECEQIGLGLDEFCEICLSAMQGIAEDLGL